MNSENAIPVCQYSKQRRATTAKLLFCGWALAAISIIVCRLCDTAGPHETTFRVSLWVILLILVMTTVMVALGAKLMCSRSVWMQYKGYGLIISSAVTVLLTIPHSLLSFVIISESGFVVRDFYWFDSRHDELRFNELRSISILTRSWTGEPVHSLMYTMKDHRSRSISIESVPPHALQAILSAAQIHGVEITGSESVLAQSR